MVIIFTECKRELDSIWFTHDYLTSIEFLLMISL